MAASHLPFDDVLEVYKLTVEELEQDGGFPVRFRNKQPICITDFVASWRASETFLDATNIATGFAASLENDSLMKDVDVFIAHDDKTFVKSEDFTEVRRMSIDSLLTAVFPEQKSALSSWRLQHQPNNTDTDSTAEAAHETIDLHGKQRVYLRSSIPSAFYETDIVSPAELLFSKTDRHPTDRFKQENNLIWISTPGNVTPLHYDRCHGLLCQVVGEKRVYFIAPSYTACIYQQPAYSPLSHTTRVDFQALVDSSAENATARTDQLKRFPKIARCEVSWLHLKPGMCCYIPPGFWHHVETLTPSVSITWAWDPSATDPTPPNMFR